MPWIPCFRSLTALLSRPLPALVSVLTFFSLIFPTLFCCCLSYLNPNQKLKPFLSIHLLLRMPELSLSVSHMACLSVCPFYPFAFCFLLVFLTSSSIPLPPLLLVAPLSPTSLRLRASVLPCGGCFFILECVSILFPSGCAAACHPHHDAAIVLVALFSSSATIIYHTLDA